MELGLLADSLKIPHSVFPTGKGRPPMTRPGIEACICRQLKIMLTWHEKHRAIIRPSAVSGLVCFGCLTASSFNLTIHLNRVGGLGPGHMSTRGGLLINYELRQRLKLGIGWQLSSVPNISKDLNISRKHNQSSPYMISERH